MALCFVDRCGMVGIAMGCGGSDAELLGIGAQVIVRVGRRRETWEMGFAIRGCASCAFRISRTALGGRGGGLGLGAHDDFPAGHEEEDEVEQSSQCEYRVGEECELDRYRLVLLQATIRTVEIHPSSQAVGKDVGDVYRRIE